MLSRSAKKDVGKPDGKPKLKPPKRSNGKSQPANDQKEKPVEEPPDPDPFSDSELVELRSNFGRTTATKEKDLDGGGETESQLWDIQGKDRRVPDDARAERTPSWDGLDPLEKEQVGRGTSMDQLMQQKQEKQQQQQQEQEQLEQLPSPLAAEDGSQMGGGDGGAEKSKTGGTSFGASFRARLAPRKRTSKGGGGGVLTGEATTMTTTTPQQQHLSPTASAPPVVPPTPPASGTLSPTSFMPVPKGLAPLRNEQAALVFIKPPASGCDKCSELVKSMLSKAGVEVVSEGVLHGGDIHDQGLIDSHYAAISNRAMTLEPHELTYNVPATGQAAFLNKFGVPWAAAVEDGLVVNCNGAMEALGVDATTLEARWRAIPSEDLLKIAGGFYCGRFTLASTDGEEIGEEGDEPGALSIKKGPSRSSMTSRTNTVSSAATSEYEHDYSSSSGSTSGSTSGGGIGGSSSSKSLFVVNGFYLGMRAAFVERASKVQWFSVRFPISLAFKDFREKLIGSTDPSKAAEGSIRRAMFEQWDKGLGLPSQPNTGANGVHASASPLEGLFERMNWLGLAVEEDPYGRELVAAGVPVHVLSAWAGDPVVTFEGAPHSVFELHEGLDSPQCTRKAALVYASDRKAKERMVRASSEGSKELFGDAPESR